MFSLDLLCCNPLLHFSNLIQDMELAACITMHSFAMFCQFCPGRSRPWDHLACFWQTFYAQRARTCSAICFRLTSWNCQDPKRISCDPHWGLSFQTAVTPNISIIINGVLPSEKIVATMFSKDFSYFGTNYQANLRFVGLAIATIAHIRKGTCWDTAAVLPERTWIVGLGHLLEWKESLLHKICASLIAWRTPREISACPRSNAIHSEHKTRVW